MKSYMENKDLTKPFCNVWEEGEKIILELNSPNDQIGDFAFEYDFDGSARKRWQDYIEELDRKGIRGQLEYKKVEMLKNPYLDEMNPFNKENPLESYKLEFLDVSN